MQKFKKAFTLVELIVVIVILSILATIAFLSFSNYSGATRDSNRLSDINSISKSIELYLVKTGVYPTPDNSFTITYSGGNVWYQGTIGDTLYRKISSNINKKPIDPLNNSEYIYSLLSYGNSYQIKSSYEGDSVSYNDTLENTKYKIENTTTKNGIYKIENNSNIFNPINKTQASTGNPKIAYIKGTYQGIVVKTTTGSTICILATPSIITNTGTVGNTYEIGSNTLSGTLLYHGQSTSSGIYYNPNKPIYCSTSLPTNDTNSGLTNIASGIINAYSGTVVTTINPKIKDIVNTPISQLGSLGGSIVSGQLGGGASMANNLGGGITLPDPFIICTATGQTYTSSSTYSDIYGICSEGDKIICSGVGTGQIWSMCNLGSSTAGLTSASYGNYYQFGRNDTGWTSGWTATDNAWGETTNTDLARKGPCPDGRHIPSKPEWRSTMKAVNPSFTSTLAGGSSTQITTALKLPFGGSKEGGSLVYQGSRNRYWSSSITNSTYGYGLIFNSTNINPDDNHSRANGYTIRCLKN